MPYPYGFLLRHRDARQRDLIRNGMPYVHEGILIQKFGYKEKGQPEFQPYMVELFGTTKQLPAPSMAAFRAALRDMSPLAPHPPLINQMVIKREMDLAVLGDEAVYYHVGSTVTVYIWLARLKRAVAGDRRTSLELTDRNYRHAYFSPIVHEILYYQAGRREETNGGELLEGGDVDYHTIELMKGYGFLRLVTAISPENRFALGRKPKQRTAEELTSSMDDAWIKLPAHRRTKPNLAEALGYSESGLNAAMRRLRINYKTWRKKIETIAK